MDKETNPLNMKPALLILAAGIGSRYGGLKQLDRIGPSGETIVDYSIYDAVRSGFGKVVFVIKESIEKEFKEAFIDRLKGHVDTDYVLQEIWKVPEGTAVSGERQKPWGTGHAVLMAKEVIQTPFAVINSDDFYGRGAYRALSGFYEGWNPEKEAEYCMAGYHVSNTLSEFGAVSRGVCQTDEHGFLVDVVERTHIERTTDGIAFLNDRGDAELLSDHTIVSMNFWGFTPSFFAHLDRGFREFIATNGMNPKAEYYIPTEVNHLVKTGVAKVRVMECREKWFGMTYREDRDMVVNSIRSLIKNGTYPENLWG
jgi:UTP-glucose-1-phosphate uridylyltransferase